jgi:flagellar protein FliJ
MAREQLEVVQELAGRHEKEAGARLSSAQGTLASAEAQLKQIIDYRQDYHQLATGARGGVIDTHQIQAARHFLSELDKIAGRQRTTIQQAELALEQQRASWIEAKRRLVAIEQLRAKRNKERAIANEKWQQRELDELYSIRRSFLD